MALPSSGPHSNGFSLIRKMLAENLLEFSYDLLAPTKIYVKEFKKYSKFIKGAAHITGGGLIYNLPRIFPTHLAPSVDSKKIKVPDIFNEIGQYVPTKEMYKTFNMGVGMVVVVAPENVDKITSGYIIGEVVPKWEKP